MLREPVLELINFTENVMYKQRKVTHTLAYKSSYFCNLIMVLNLTFQTLTLQFSRIKECVVYKTFKVYNIWLQRYV